MKYVGGVALTLAMMIIAAVIRAWGLSVLWGWFIVPAFGLPAISKVTAFGISAIVGMFTSYDSKKAESEADAGGAEILGKIIGAFLGVAIGTVFTVVVCWFVLAYAAG